MGSMQRGCSLSVPQLGAAGGPQARGWPSAEGNVLVRY